MTTIAVSLSPFGDVSVSADRQGSGGNYKSDRKTSKLCVKSGIIFGGVGSFRMIQMLKHGTLLNELVVPLRFKSSEEFEEYLSQQVVPILKQYVSTDLLDSDKDSWSIIAAVPGHFAIIHSDLQVEVPDKEFTSIGSGSEYALGFLSGDSVSTERAVRVASQFDPSTGGELIDTITIMADGKISYNQ